MHLHSQFKSYVVVSDAIDRHIKTNTDYLSYKVQVNDIYKCKYG